MSVDTSTVKETSRDGHDQKFGHTGNPFVPYLLENSAEFRRLSALRQMGWSNPEGDAFFRKQRQTADANNERTAFFFYELMKAIGNELHHSTNAFAIPKCNAGQPTVLDMCMAPGGFLATVLSKNPGASALAFSLPMSSGGHKALLPRHFDVKTNFLDITMLAADLGVTGIPLGHPDANNFLPQYFENDQLFDLALCDGQVLRTHDRASYRETREARRLTVTQLALGLEHLRPGGSMIVLLHKLEALDTVDLLWTFHKFSSVRVFKPKKGHAKRSSFYMVATAVQKRHPAAIQAVVNWKMTWNLATFASDTDYHQALCMSDAHIAELLEGFSSKLVNLGEGVWRCQADALENASFIQKRDSQINHN